MKEMGVGLTTIGLAGAGIGVGRVFAGFLGAYAMNPKLKSELFTYTILGFAFVESMGLFSLMLSFMLLFM